MVRISVKQVVCNCVILVVIAALLMTIHKFGKPYKRGFYCDDESLRYPYTPSTVSRKALLITSVWLPAIFILLTEVFRTLVWKRNYTSRTFKPGQKFHRLVVRLCIFTGHFFIGAFFNTLLLDIAKYGVGRQRPHFIEACKPNVGYQNCTVPHEYITDFNCTEKNHHLVHTSHLSFYSGHAAFSFYAAWYISLYLQARLYRPLASSPLVARLALHMVHFALFGGAAFVAYTRVSDHHHHQSDVLVGVIMGSSIGIVNAVVFAKLFRRKKTLDDVKRSEAYQVDSSNYPQEIRILV